MRKIAKSTVPFVKKAFEEFCQEQPEASKWLDERLNINESLFAREHGLSNAICGLAG